MAKKKAAPRRTKKQIEQQNQMRIEIVCFLLFLLVFLTVLGEFGLTSALGDALVFGFKFIFGVIRFIVYPFLTYTLYQIFKAKKLPAADSRMLGVVLIFLAISILACIPAYFSYDDVGVIMDNFFLNISDTTTPALSGGGIIGISIFAYLRVFTGIPGTLTIASFATIVGFALCLQKTLHEMIGESLVTTKNTITDTYDNYQEKQKIKKAAFDVDGFYDDEVPELDDYLLEGDDEFIYDEVADEAEENDARVATNHLPVYDDEPIDYYKDFGHVEVGADEPSPRVYAYDHTSFDVFAEEVLTEQPTLMHSATKDFDEFDYYTDEPQYGVHTPLHDEDGVIMDESMHMVTPVAESVVTKKKPYRLPALQLLDTTIGGPKTQNKDRSTQKAKLQTTLESFNVDATVTNVHVGPAVTQYEVTLAPGVKVNRIVNLQTDIALALAAKGVRIEAPIPGKAAVGIEVPNESVQMVGLYDVLRPAHANKERKLLVGLGKKISGEAMQIELNKMPHLLVAGSTGSGKSVCINSIVTSILLRATPEEVKFVMVDPKKVELNVYNDIPHLLSPVVTDAKKAAVTLHKVVTIMEERYELFADAFVRNMESYNAYAKEKGLEELPFIVVIIDELADLMVVAAKEVEEAIMRLAQMARAAGIHMIVATQRPSVDVITGVIKSNIPSRIAFAVSSQVDSRTILDMGGAERLVGKGDMLYLDAGENKPIRVQGAYVSEAEIEKIVTFVKEQQTVTFDETLIQATTTEAMDELFALSDEVDELFEEAVAFAISVQMISASKLQRRFRLGYNRAARILDEMVDRNLLGPSAGNKGRPVLIKDISEIQGKKDVMAEDIYGTSDDVDAY